MTEQQIGALIAVTGLVSQLAGTVLLVGLFAALLRSHPRPQPYFRQWTIGWVALVVALCGVAVQYAFPQFMTDSPLAPRVANFVYQAGKLLVVLLLEDVSRESEDARSQLVLAHDRLKQLSLYDPLTGALNRRAYDEGAGLEALGGRFGTALMLDMDNLKVVNDTAGHAAGDELLRRLVETLRHCVRPLDRIYRWGGDEFLLLFPSARPEEVVPRLRDALRAVPELEASVGAARFSGREDLPAAIERADRAMYEEKERNRARRRIDASAVAPERRGLRMS